MPCFKGIAVSVHAEGAPLPEFGINRQSRFSRINTFIPVPQPKVPRDSTTNKPEPAKFAISITLLTPGLSIPYSTPKPTPENPYPQPQTVAGLPGLGEKANYGGQVGPYIPITKSENETIAAYIYFDGRAKEEVATLLRPSEETWVNSRWVQVPESEGGGLAEREFLFREVGLERWLNGLDLDGQDAAARIEKRRQKFEKRRRRRKEENGSDEELADMMTPKKRSIAREVLRYGSNEQSPVEKVSDDEDFSSDSDDDDAFPEAAGQIKVAMFRVLASGEIKRGEYSPQFDAHDDDEEGEKGNGEGDGGDIDHTTSFAKPKTLDPKSISTQTVTGIDGPDKPFAVFTFFYRGERQLQKMGILPNSKQQKPGNSATKRRSRQLDFSNLAPLKSGGTVGFSAFRDTNSSAKRSKTRKKSNGSSGNMLEDSEDDDDDDNGAVKMEEADEKEVKTLLSPEDAKFQGELADGVGRIKLKRQHSAEKLDARSPSAGGNSATATPPIETDTAATLPNNVFGKSLTDDNFLGSPLKRHRASLHGDTDSLQKRLGAGFGGIDVIAAAEAAHTPLPEPAMKKILGDNALSPFTADFEQRVNKALERWHVPGISIAVVDGDHEWSAGYGISHFPSTKVTPETLFYTGSTTKAFVAALTSLVVDNGTLQWNTPISSIIRDDFVMEDDYATHHVTVEDALSHRTGLPRHDMSYGGTYEGRDGTIRDIVRSIRWLPMTAEMRLKFQYCNIMYIVMSYVLETLKGQWFGDLLYEHLWHPLGMESTYFSTSAAQDGPEDLAQGYDYYNHKYHEVPFMNLTLTSGAGSIISNVLDYSKWLKALINKSAPLSKAGHNAVRTPRTIDIEPGTPFTGTLTYTLGWNFGVYHGHEFFMHEGGMEAFGALVIFFPALKYGLVSFGNTGMTSNFVEETMIFHLIDEKLKIPREDRFDWSKYREESLKLKDDAYKNAISRNYPHIPKPALPPTLPIANYTGTYFHPAYRNATITFDDSVLKIDRTKQQLWKIAGEIKHISGDFFMAYLDSTTAPESEFKGALPAEFRVDENGVAKSFGVMFEGTMKEKIWFERV
ncbi:beta-lactamase-type transpeptidase fold domain containing protein [Rutstroemia sp. NJR-2017a WRK4]|nr:beta-lactamase-type transpeptidase fold domain containing protein [Rutstroemia sp. NJR-2017a WRK4]PQE14840.1 beta-lactamase-type transpeptidase fold domain containing protein [Rutstroemia sp. NJR-2017a WRK4]